MQHGRTLAHFATCQLPGGLILLAVHLPHPLCPGLPSCLPAPYGPLSREDTGRSRCVCLPEMRCAVADGDALQQTVHFDTTVMPLGWGQGGGSFLLE